MECNPIMIRDIKTTVVVKVSSFSSSISSQNDISTNQRRSLNGSENDDLIFQTIKQRINQLKQEKQKAFLNKRLIHLKIKKTRGFISSFIFNVFIGFFDLRRETAELYSLLKHESWHIVPIISKYKKKFYENLRFF